MDFKGMIELLTLMDTKAHQLRENPVEKQKVILSTGGKLTIKDVLDLNDVSLKRRAGDTICTIVGPTKDRKYPHVDGSVSNDLNGVMMFIKTLDRMVEEGEIEKYVLWGEDDIKNLMTIPSKFDLDVYCLHVSASTKSVHYGKPKIGDLVNENVLRSCVFKFGDTKDAFQETPQDKPGVNMVMSNAMPGLDQDAIKCILRNFKANPRGVKTQVGIISKHASIISVCEYMEDIKAGNFNEGAEFMLCINRILTKPAIDAMVSRTGGDWITDNSEILKAINVSPILGKVFKPKRRGGKDSKKKSEKPQPNKGPKNNNNNNK